MNAMANIMSRCMTRLVIQVCITGTLFLTACSKESEVVPISSTQELPSTEVQSDAKLNKQTFTTYIIRKGQHSTSSPFKSLRTSSLRFEAVFDKSAVYTTVNPVNQADINKLYGMADCGTLHQTNSARFGWRWYNNRLEILAYVYRGGNWSYKYITSIDLDKMYTYELSLASYTYVFRVNGIEVTLPRNCSGQGNGYQLYPYFGGDEVAPHDITIRIKDL